MNYFDNQASPFQSVSHVLDTAWECPEHILMKSKKNCHVSGLNSFVIGVNEDGGLIRVFVALPDSDLHLKNNMDGLSLGIHNHRYPLRLIGLAGVVMNMEYSISPIHPRRPASWDQILNAYRFGPMGSEIGFCGLRRVSQVSEDRIEDLILPPESFHTVVVSSPGVAVWVAIEGPEVPGADPLCLTTQDMLQWSREGLYEPFSYPDEVMASLTKALR